MTKSTKWLAAILILSAVSCSKQEENLAPKNNMGDQPEEAFIGQQGTIKSGSLYGVGINYMEIDNHKVYEGDIILTEEQLAQQTVENQRTQGTGRTRLTSRWPNNTVYYNIDPALTNQVRVTDAIKHWEANTALRFVIRTTQSNYITFRPGTGCSSNVGMTGSRQYINLATGCSTGSTIHEIGHAVGLWHEQSRADRDKYIKIHFQNIQAGYENNFRTYLERGMDGFDHGNLDFGSIMMYPSRSFSVNNLPTITKLDGSTYSTQRNGLSAGDIATIRTMYAGTTPPPPTGTVTVYQHCSSGGIAVSFAVGNYTLSQMQAKGALNDWISSVKVPSGRTVVFYEHDNFTGATLTKTADDACLVDDNWNDKTSSMIVK